MSIAANRQFINHLPSTIIWIIVGICVFPGLLQLLGVDFGLIAFYLEPLEIAAMSAMELQQTVFNSMAGAFVHLLLEWSAVMIAMATAVLAFIQYRLTGNLVTAVIGMALLCAGIMDGFHAMAATKLIHSLADNENFIPFTWALSRMFNALILLLGASFFFLRIKKGYNAKEQNRLLLIAGLFFIGLSYILMHFTTLSNNLPQTMFNDRIITRPFDVIPLILFLILAIWVFPKLYKQEKSVFSHALMWSMVPAIFTQMHMAFGSDALFDSHFNVAHFLKTVFYLVPFVGLSIDYINIYTKERMRLVEVERARLELERKNKELKQFVYIASHDLQEPLRTVMSFTEMLKEESKNETDGESQMYFEFIEQATQRMSALIKGLLDYGLIGRRKEIKEVDSYELIKNVIDDLNASISETGAVIRIEGELPKIMGYETELRLLFQNLLSNAIKFRKKGQTPIIHINAHKENGFWKFAIQDNGIGIAPEHKDRIFAIFQRLHKKNEYEGTGIGLAHCRKVAELHGGKIWVESQAGEGSTFYVTLKSDDL